MNVKNVEKKENNTADLTVEITGAEFDGAINKVYSKVKNQIALPGFRKGKAPRKLVEKMYGEGIFWEDAANDLSCTPPLWKRSPRTRAWRSWAIPRPT